MTHKIEERETLPFLRGVACRRDHMRSQDASWRPSRRSRAAASPLKCCLSPNVASPPLLFQAAAAQKKVAAAQEEAACWRAAAKELQRQVNAMRLEAAVVNAVASG